MNQDYKLNAALMQHPTTLQFNSLTVMAFCLFFILAPPLCLSSSSETDALGSREILVHCLARDQIADIH